MKLATGILAAALATTLVAATAGAAPYREEHVTGGVLDLAWTNGFDTSNNMQPLTLDPSHPAYANPSGDHTVAVATNAIADSGGIIVTSISTQGVDDYIWEGWMFTGDGDTRRGLIVRATPVENATNFYMLVMESGMVRIRFRKLVGQTPTTLGDWFLNTLPPGVPLLNSWHHLKIQAIGGNFRCWWDDYELTGPGGTIVDNDLTTGNVGCYNFRFDLGGIPVYFDDLLLTDYATPTTSKTWGAIKKLYR